MSEMLPGFQLYSLEHFLSPQNLQLADDTVSEVFKTVLDFRVDPQAPPAAIPSHPFLNGRTAIVGFSGVMRGYCAVRMESESACSIASAMLGGIAVDGDDHSIDDAVGEICNMIAGGWKNRVPELSSRCSLAPPTVISGRDYKVHTVKPSATLSRVYKFDRYTFELTLDFEQRSSG